MADKNIVVSTHGEHGIRIRELDKSTDKVVKSTFLNNHKIVKTDTKNAIPHKLTYYKYKDPEFAETESYLKNILDELDFKILCLRKSFISTVIQPRTETNYKPVITPVTAVKKNVPVKNKKGVLSREQMAYVEILEKLFNDVHEKLNTIPTQNFRYKVKNSYNNGKIDGANASKVLKFKEISPSGENISINFVNYNKKKYAVIAVTQLNGTVKPLIINPDGEVVKTPHPILIRDPQHHRRMEYYSQYEINEMDILQYMIALRKELKNYGNYIEKCIASREFYKPSCDTGSVEDCAQITANIYKNYCRYKKNIMHLGSKERSSFRYLMGFVPMQGNPALVIKNINKDKEIVHLSFPVFDGKKCTKLLVLNDENKIAKTFYIMDNKLVKFNAGSIHSKKQINRQICYYSQEEIDKSGLREYLKAVNERLESAVESLSRFDK